uniref:CDP-glycerol glycerophosphotransferase family protein n=1 Tax=Campylobacter coli TaxID=195 RepID=UPI0009311FFF
TQYVIISAVYNVEKYLDDYFKSIINQRLDFKKNIFMILVDDGSTDNSAQIIKKYQKKYPKNITYLYKENGGQASARNLGLKYLQENESLKDKFTWVTFTDPDDFLDIDYFYEVDEFLANHQDDDIGMIGCNYIFWYENNNIFKDTHPLKFKFEKENNILLNRALNVNIQLSAATAFFKSEMVCRTYAYPLLFNEEIPNFEDAYFANLFLVQNLNLKSVFLKKAKYYYRKRGDGTSTLDNIKSSNQKQLMKEGYFSLLALGEKIHRNIPVFIQQTILYDLIWFIKENINKDNFSFYSQEEKDEMLVVLEQIFAKIDSKIILEFNLAGCWFFHKVGILNCFKNEYPPFQITYIEDFDAAKRQILLRYFTPDDKDIESIRIDGREVYADTEKIVQHDFLTRVFIYEKRLWIHIPENFKKLEIFIRGQRARITLFGKQHQSLEIKQLESGFQVDFNEQWLLVDKDINADDNAEHFYRYIKQNYPYQKAFFALRKDSKDWDRLEKEGFNLVEWGSDRFEKVLKQSSKIISSHIDAYLVEYFGKKTLDGKSFVFLQHGVIKDDLSSWLNSKKINLFIASTQKEYESIAGDYNHYRFGKKEVVLTGLARHDSLLQKNNFQNKQILIMPTWRKNLVGFAVNSALRELKEGFNQSEYFCKWNGLLKSDTLQKLSQEYGYKILFNPHPNIMPYLKDFEIPSFVSIANENESLQELFCKSSLMITDYSSVAFEMAYLNKPVIYYQFDQEEFFNSHTYQKGYFDYEKDGFGPVVTTGEDLLRELEILLENNCKVGEPYKSNIENTFAFRDGKCCERIYREILKLDEPYQNEISLDYVKQKAQDALGHECYLEAMWRFQYLLENSQNFDEEIAKNCLEVAMEVEKGYEIAKIILEKDYQNMSRELKFLIIKNILSNKKALKEEVEQCLEVLETMETPKEKEKEFLFSKLRIYFYRANRKRINEIVEELQTKYGVSKEDIHFEMLFTTNAISLWGGGTIIDE